MLYLLCIMFPVSMAGGCFILRKQAGLTVALGVAAALVECALVALLPVDRAARLIGLTVVLDPLGRLFLLAFLGLGAASFLAASQVPHGENFVPVALLILALTATTILMLQEPFTVALLLISAGVIAVLAIVDLPAGSPALVGRVTIATALKYLVLMVVAGVMMYMAFVLITLYQPGEVPGRVSPSRLTLALMAVGFGLRLAVIPFHSWLPDLVEHAAPLVTILVAAVVNTTSLLFLIQALEFFPIVVFENERGMAILMAIGVITAIVGGLLALGQESMRRVVGYLLVYNAGMVLFGLATASGQGLAGALFESFSQLIAIALLLVSVAILERPDGRPGATLRHDLLWRWPVGGLGLLGGGVAILGLPPLGGFAGKLLLYEAAGRVGGPYLIGMLAATLLATLAVVRLARERLFGAPEALPQDERPELLSQTELDRPAERRLEREPRELALLTVALLALSLVLGAYPQPVLSIINDVVRGLPFVRI
jgi:formate hydrogenlyase subunit 3/multisubunit Na+/H+ antiporter MnhD subunit